VRGGLAPLCAWLGPRLDDRQTQRPRVAVVQARVRGVEADVLGDRGESVVGANLESGQVLRVAGWSREFGEERGYCLIHWLDGRGQHNGYSTVCSQRKLHGARLRRVFLNITGAFLAINNVTADRTGSIYRPPFLAPSMLLDLPLDAAYHVLTLCTLDDLGSVRRCCRQARRLALAAVASPAWRARPGNAAALRLEMWRRGASECSLLGGGPSAALPHRHAPLARCVAVSTFAHREAGAVLASADDSGVAVLWQLDRRGRGGVATLRHQRPLLCVALNADALASGCDDGSVWLWPLCDALLVGRDGTGGTGGSGADRRGDVSPPHPRKPSRSMLTPPSGVRVGALAWVGPSQLLSAGADRTIRLWETGTPTRGAREEAAEVAEAAAEEGRGAGGCGRVANERRPAGSPGPAPLHAARAHSKPVVALAAACGGAACGGGANPALSGLVLSGSSDGNVRAWDVAAGLRCVRNLHTCNAAVTCLAWESSVQAACASADGVVRLWDMRLRRECFASLSPGRGGLGLAANAVALADGALFCAGHGGQGDRTVAIWDLRQRRVVTRLAGHLGAITALAVVSGGDVVSADAAGSVRMWSLERAYRAAPASGDAELRW